MRTPNVNDKNGHATTREADLTHKQQMMAFMLQPTARIAVLVALIFVAGCARRSDEKTILFICEHGSAKSIVAAAHFNRLAEQEGISVKAISRGTNPDAVVPDKINQILNGDGFPSHEEKPVQLTTNDLTTSDYIVTFKQLPDEFGAPNNVELWNVPSFEAGYPTARDSILNNIKKMIVRIKAEGKNNP